MEVSGAQVIRQKYEQYCGENNIPGGRDLPFFRQDQILSPDLLSRSQQALSTIPGKIRSTGIVKDIIYIGMAETTFNKKHKVVNIKPLTGSAIRFYDQKQNHTPSAATQATIDELRTTLTERFATELGLTGTHRLYMTCLSYLIPEGAVDLDPLFWHDDHNNSWTMVTLLSDPDGEAGWEGGNLLLAPSKPEETADGRQTEVPDYERTVTIEPRLNCSIFFHNHGTKHNVSPVTSTIRASSGAVDEDKASEVFDSIVASQSQQVPGKRFSERIVWCIEDHCESNCRHAVNPDEKPGKKGCVIS